MAYGGSYTPEAHALYASARFTEYDLSEPWEMVVNHYHSAIGVRVDMGSAASASFK